MITGHVMNRTPRFGTFSIVARCDRTGMLGVAISSAAPAVGAVCPYARARVGALSTQSFSNPYHGIDGLQFLAQGLSPEETLKRLLDVDPGRDFRQDIVVDKSGRSAAFTGPKAIAWKGHITGPNYAVAGNILTGSGTVEAIGAAFESAPNREFADRLLTALEAGQAAGGDSRGKQSAALLIVDREEYPACDLRVDDHPEPIRELRRIFEVARVQLIPLVQILPTRANPSGGRNDSVVEILLRRVEERPPSKSD